MRSRKLFGALTLASTLLFAACGSTNTTSPAASAAPATDAVPTSMPVTGSSMPMDSSMPMGTHPTASDTMNTAAMGMSDAAPAKGLTLKLTTSAFASGQQAEVSFKVVGSDGSTVNDYQVEQTKELHLVLVRSDLTGYQHIHPNRVSDGTWSIPVTFAKGGTYRMVADFVPVINGTATGRTAVVTELTVTGPGSDTALPPVATSTMVDGYMVTIAGRLRSSTESTLTFSVTGSSGKPTVLEPYLGAFGHLVAFAQSDLAYTHIHPNTADENLGTLTFLGQVAAPGLHRLFMQFAAAGTVHTAEFTINAR